MWAASILAAGWKLTQLVRAPRDTDLRAVTGCTVLVAVALSAQLLAGVAPAGPDSLLAQSPKLIQNITLTAFFSLLLSLLRSTAATVDPQVGRGHGSGYTEPALAVLTSVALIAAFVASAPATRGAAYGTATTDPGVVAFYLVGNLYMLYATASGAHLTWSAARQARARAVRVSLRVAGAGLVVCCVGCHLPRVLDTGGQLALGRAPLPGPDPAGWTTPALASGIVVFFAGIGYPGARSGLLRLRLRARQRRHHRELAPLWTVLTHRFPKLVLLPPPGWLAQLIGPSPLRYYRRVVECRDGLTHLAVYLRAPIPADAPPATQAQLVVDALHRSLAEDVYNARLADDSPGGVIAAPAAPGTAEDTNALLALARALRGSNGQTVL